MSVTRADPVSPMVGIVSYLTEVELARGAPDVFVAAARGPDMQVLGYETGASTVGSGAGLTWDAARGAAVGECLERYSSAIVHAEDLTIGSHDQLTRNGRNAHDPSTWALFDEAQHVPYPAFTRDLPIAWLEGWDLSTRAPLFVPACLARLSSSPTLKEQGARVIGPSVSTGCACAVSPDEALRKGLCELIERDAFMIVWRNRLPIPEVRIDADSALYDVYTRCFARPGLEYRIWQTTLDFALPSFVGILFDHRGKETRMIVGGAANPDPERAVQKTLCELVQGLCWIEYMGTDPRRAAMSAGDIHSFNDRAFFYASHDVPEAFSFLPRDATPVALSTIAAAHRGSREASLESLVAMLVQKGFRPAAVDLTTDDVRQCGYCVMRAVVPGLVTMEGDARLPMQGGERWRQVPVDLAYRRTPAAIADINPHPHPYP